jgi:hypothetical protein
MITPKTEGGAPPDAASDGLERYAGGNGAANGIPHRIPVLGMIGVDHVLGRQVQARLGHAVQAIHLVGPGQRVAVGKGKPPVADARHLLRHFQHAIGARRQRLGLLKLLIGAAQGGRRALTLADAGGKPPAQAGQPGEHQHQADAMEHRHHMPGGEHVGLAAADAQHNRRVINPHAALQTRLAVERAFGNRSLILAGRLHLGNDLADIRRIARPPRNQHPIGPQHGYYAVLTDVEAGKHVLQIGYRDAGDHDASEPAIRPVDSGGDRQLHGAVGGIAHRPADKRGTPGIAAMMPEIGASGEIESRRRRRVWPDKRPALRIEHGQPVQPAEARQRGRRGAVGLHLVAHPGQHRLHHLEHAVRLVGERTGKIGRFRPGIAKRFLPGRPDAGDVGADQGEAGQDHHNRQPELEALEELYVHKRAEHRAM